MTRWPIYLLVCLAIPAFATAPDPPAGACYRLHRAQCFDPPMWEWCISCYCEGDFIPCEGELLWGGDTEERVLTSTPGHGRDPLFPVSYPWIARFPECKDGACFCEWLPEESGYCDGWVIASSAVPCP